MLQPPPVVTNLVFVARVNRVRTIGERINADGAWALEEKRAHT